jgi:hypothetical protein
MTGRTVKMKMMMKWTSKSNNIVIFFCCFIFFCFLVALLKLTLFFLRIVSNIKKRKE